MPDKQNSTDNVPIFVFFKLAKPPESWKMGKLAKGWWWVGEGSTTPITKRGLPSKPMEYPREEQYAGPKETREKMKDYLDMLYKKLKEDGIVEKYKIRYSYAP